MAGKKPGRYLITLTAVPAAGFGQAVHEKVTVNFAFVGYGRADADG